MEPRILGVLGGRDMDDDRLRSWAVSANLIYAADSGADRLIDLGFEPTVVGDFDSFAHLPASEGLRLVQSIDQDTTDCDKLLDLVRSDGHGSVTLIGTEGDLPDHVLATYSSVALSELTVRIAFRTGIGHIVKPGNRVVFEAEQEQRVSLMPITACTGVVLSGVIWPLSSGTLSPGGAVSVSNVALGGEVSAQVRTGAALLYRQTAGVTW